MLSDKIKQRIRQSYKSIGDQLPHFVPRKQQNVLVAEIAKTLAGEYDKSRKIITIEAGTGTGKSLAYCLGAIPLAINRGKTVCISTATVALQEQLVNKDLPLFKQHAGVNFDFALVKGRQRYVCRQRLAVANTNDDNLQTELLWTQKPSEFDLALIEKLQTALKNGTWLGDRDSWPDAIPNHIWSQIQSDKHSCLKSLSEHQQCPFHKARETMDMAQVLVINHSLLLSDLALGGGKILPAQDECIYIIDEAHHLPQVTRDHASASVTIKGSIDWLNKLSQCGDKISQLCKSDKTIAPALKLADDIQALLADLAKIQLFIQANTAVYFAKENLYRFEHGVLPKALKQLAPDISSAAGKCVNHVNKLYTQLMEAVKDNEVKMYLAEPLLAEAGFYLQRLENLQQLWHMYAKTDSEKSAPLARWLEKTDGKRDDVLLSASPIEVGYTLDDLLWTQCEGAILCSATLRALNSFQHFRMQAGLSDNDGSQYLHVDSPFNYQQNAQLVIADMPVEPTAPQFTDELVRKLAKIINVEEATLVLFSSHWQMKQVAQALRKQKFSLKVQGEESRQEIIAHHKNKIEKNQGSIIFGSQSFSEGLDLPGKLLTHVIITKLPFAVPTSPVEEAQSEYISAKGGNPFLSITVPDASKKLVQACGRLLRSEQDTGKITILDRRLVSKRYGKALLDALPPFARIVE